MHRRWRHHRRWPMNPVGRYLRMRLHRRIFAWFGVAILTSALAVALASHFSGGSSAWRQEVAGAEKFVGNRFERVWDEPAQRDELAQSIANDLQVDLRILDARGLPIASYGNDCRPRVYDAAVIRGTEQLGTVRLCLGRHWAGYPRFPFLPPLVVGGLMLWMISGGIARTLTRPLGEVARVAEDIGRGKLDSRVQLPWRQTGGEVGMLGSAINEMAGRIQKQMADQRELLAAVSHELRTPLARLRLLAELGRQSGSDPKIMDDFDREVVEIDKLVGDLLATSRLDFKAMNVHRLDGVDLARRALARAGQSAEKLILEVAEAPLEGDATLLGRALANLLENAEHHGKGIVALRVKQTTGAWSFEVDDQGPGFAPGEESRAFEAFYHRPREPDRDQGGLGLGLALVQRIAEAHGGRAYARNRAEGGATVGFEVASLRSSP